MAAQNGLFNLGDGLGDLNTAWAGLRAVKSCAAAPHTLFVVQDFETNVCCFVSGVEDEAVSVDDSGWAEILPIGPEHRAAGGAGRTENALGRVIKACALLRGLKALFFWL